MMATAARRYSQTGVSSRNVVRVEGRWESKLWLCASRPCELLFPGRALDCRPTLARPLQRRRRL
jgi:hypothetical protein